MQNVIKGISVNNVVCAVALALVTAGAVYAEQSNPQPDMRALQKTLGAMQQQAAGAAATVVDARQLRALLPERVGDMKRTRANSQRNSSMGITVAEATGEYSGPNDAQAIISFSDIAGLGGLAFAQMDMIGDVDNESDTRYEKTYVHKGVKVLENYDFEDKSGGINTVVGGRFTVTITMSNVKPERLKAALDAIDVKKLAELNPEQKKE